MYIKNMRSISKINAFGLYQTGTAACLRRVFTYINNQIIAFATVNIEPLW